MLVSYWTLAVLVRHSFVDGSLLISASGCSHLSYYSQKGSHAQKWQRAARLRGPTSEMQRCCQRRSRTAITAGQRRGAASRPRFYKHTSVERDGDAWRVTLDARPLPSPAGQALRLPSQRLALAIAAEWDAQIDRIEPAAMPLMALASTAIDQIPKERDQTVRNILAYAVTDTCRFVADAAREPEVRRSQDRLHGPILAWLHEKHGAELARGAPGALRAPPTAPEAVDALAEACEALSNYRLAALQAATFESKSIAIGLALLGLHIDAEEAEAAARVEETANIERWGLVEGAHDYDLARVRVQLAAAAFFAEATS